MKYKIVLGIAVLISILSATAPAVGEEITYYLNHSNKFDGEFNATVTIDGDNKNISVENSHLKLTHFSH